MRDGRREKGETTRRRVVRIARTLFATRGYEGTSIEQVLEAADLSRGALYHHFPTKQALFDAVLDQVLEQATAAAASAAGAAPDAATALRAGLAAWLEAAHDPAVQRIAIVDAPAVVGWARVRELDTTYALAGMSALVHRLADEGRLPAVDVDVLSHMLLAAVGEAAVMAATSTDPAAALEAARATTDALVARLVGDEPSSPQAG